jgi:CRP-like cAMP-binding protein
VKTRIPNRHSVLPARVSDNITQYDFFGTLTTEEAKLLVSLGYIVSCRCGEEILNPGDPSRDIYLILNGSFEVHRRRTASHGTSMKLVKIFAPGEIFGETRYLRQDLRQGSVRAREDSTVLVFNSRSLDLLVSTAPKLAAKVFRNMARIVTSRLCDSIKFTRFPKRPAVHHRSRPKPGDTSLFSIPA